MLIFSSVWEIILLYDIYSANYLSDTLFQQNRPSGRRETPACILFARHFMYVDIAYNVASPDCIHKREDDYPIEHSGDQSYVVISANQLTVGTGKRRT